MYFAISSTLHNINNTAMNFQPKHRTWGGIRLQINHVWRDTICLRISRPSEYLKNIVESTHSFHPLWFLDETPRKRQWFRLRGALRNTVKSIRFLRDEQNPISSRNEPRDGMRIPSTADRFRGRTLGGRSRKNTRRGLHNVVEYWNAVKLPRHRFALFPSSGVDYYSKARTTRDLRSIEAGPMELDISDGFRRNSGQL